MNTDSNPIELQYTVTSADAARALTCSERRLEAGRARRVTLAALLVAMVVACLGLGIVASELAIGKANPTGVGMLAVVTGCALALVVRRLAQRRMRRLALGAENIALGPRQLVADSAGMTITAGALETRLQWSAIRDVVEDEGGFLLYLDRVNFVTVPASAFAEPESRERFRAMLQEHVQAAPKERAQPADAPAPGPVSAFGRNVRAAVRVALFRKTDAAQWAPSAGQLIALVLAGLALQFGFEFARSPEGALNLSGLPRALCYLPLLLLAAYLIARRESAPRLLLAIAILFAAVSLPYDAAFHALDIAVDREWLGQDGEYDWIASWAWYVLYAAWVLALLVGVVRLTQAAAVRAAAHAATLLLVVILPLWYIPSESLWRGADEDDAADERRDWYALGREENFYAQPAILRETLADLAPERPGVEDLYFVGVAGYASQDVFMKELRVVGELFRDRFDADERSVLLVNNPGTVHELPVASATSLAQTLEYVGNLMNPDEDVLFLYLSSHGSEDHRLTMQFWPLQLNDIDPRMLKRMLDEAGIKWRVIAISACYSGGFIEPLRDERTLIVTAADAQHTSFGCSNESDFTYFGRAYFDRALRATYSFTDAFERAKAEIGAREQTERLTPSNPQMYVGTAMQAKLRTLGERLRSQGGVITVQAPGSSGQAGTRSCTACRE